MVWRILKFTEHLFYRKHRKGYGIHSPYLFEFIHRVLFNASKFEVPEEIRIAHGELRNDPAVSSFVRRSSVSPKYGALLYRMVRWFRPEMVLELGTGLGVSCIYLASGLGIQQVSGTERKPMHTIEGNPERATFSKGLIKRFGLNGVKVHCGDVDGELDTLAGIIPGRFLAFVDANHRYDPTIRYIRLLLGRAGEESVIIMDDIYWSKGMYRAWKEIISWPEVRISIDLFHMGIILLRKDLDKVQMKIKF